jgi:hypothetical protein
MKLKNLMIVVSLLGLLIVVGAQTTAQESQQRMMARILLVDETKTFASTMRVGALAKVLKNSELVELSVKMIDVDSSYADPLSGMDKPEQPYDLVLIVPKGIDDGSISQVWLVSEYYDSSTPEYALLAMLSGVIDQVFQGLACATDVCEDLWPAAYAALYLEQGWIK